MLQHLTERKMKVLYAFRSSLFIFIIIFEDIRQISSQRFVNPGQPPRVPNLQPPPPQPPQGSSRGYAIGPQRPDEITVTFINKSGRRARIFQSNEYGYEIMYRFMLRPNEPRTAAFRRDGSFWAAYDVQTRMLMLMNGFQRFESWRATPGARLDVKIASAILPPESFPRGKVEPHYIDTLVVLDNSMVKHHGRLLMPYTLTLMNTVARAFMHKTLGVPILVAVTKIVQMRDVPSYYKIETDNPSKSVGAACKYAWTHFNEEYKFDFALILTRENIGPAGYASMYTMCTKRSCALVKESSPDSSYVIAHEMAHALGIDHDEDDACPRDNVSGGNIMVKKIFTTSANYQWSRCSQKMLRQNIRYMKCLQNKPELLPAFDFAMQNLPGEVFNMNRQCKMFHGMLAERCDNDIQTSCRYMWCRKDKKSSCRPLWWHAPLDGTECSNKKWCLRGRCITKKKTYPINGGWSRWSNYTPACPPDMKAWLIQKKNRSCDNPTPKFGGKPCQGSKERFRVMLPTDNGKCEPYSFTGLVLNSVINISALETHGCGESKRNNLDWKEYAVDEQIAYLNQFNLSCDFESPGCSWINSEEGVTYWTVGQGRTPSSRTGPSADHTFNNTLGHYLYFEASWTQNTKRLQDGDRVILKSPMIVSPTVCLRFAYHMYGQHIKGLEVFVRNGKHKRRMWQKYGDQGDRWYMAEVELAINLEYYITMEAIRGQSYYSDIAIDDISVNHGLCDASKSGLVPCTSVCVSRDYTRIFRKQQLEGAPCGEFSSTANAVCFRQKCEPVNCLGEIGKVNC